MRKRVCVAACLLVFASALAGALSTSCKPGGGAGGGGGSAPASCPANTKACGEGCIPSNGVCCAHPGDPLTSSYCTNSAGGGCSPNLAPDGGPGICKAGFPSGTTAKYCCSTNTDIGSNDCPPGQHHCGLLCSAEPCAAPGDPDGGAEDAGCAGFEGTMRLCEEDFSGCFCQDNLPESECLVGQGSACLPEGSAGCAKSYWTGSQGATSVIAPCCPGLYCSVGDACGSSGDTCLPSIAQDACDAPAQGHCVKK